jgi:hypothetical protein
MAFRIPLRSRRAVLLGTSLAACLGTVIGCNVYDDELLSRPYRADTSQPDAADGSATAMDDAPSFDGGPHDAAHANKPDATTADAVGDRDAGITADAPAPDAAPRDGNGTRADADAAASHDALDAPRDTATSSRDADAGTPAPDADDAAPSDAWGADTGARDGESASPDVATDAHGGGAPPTFRVVRVGDGTTQLSAESTAVFIEERGWDGQVVGQPLALPSRASGGQHPLTLSGKAASEGALSLSLDGRYLTLAGYATSPGRASVATSTDVERVVARIDAAATIDTTTLLGAAFSGSNVRSAASLDGAAFWVGGSAGGVWYFTVGGSGSTQIVATPDNVRLVALFGDQLYGSSGASPMTTVFTVGNGRPTTGVQSVAALAGLPRSGSSPYAFAFFDRSATVAGLDTLYLTDDRDPESDGNGGGIQKWTFDGRTWSRVATFAAVGDGSSSFRGLAGVVSPVGVILLASTSELSANRLVVFVDDGSPNVTGTVFATAPSNTIFRGVALSPQR